MVAGKGVEPNLDFVGREQLARRAGHRRRSQHAHDQPEDVYAAGDVAECRNRVTRKREPVTNWINACEQGRVAGANLAGHEVTTPGSVAENVTTLFGLPVASIGVTRAGKDEALRELVWQSSSQGQYRKLFLRGDRLVGAVLLGDISGAGVLRSVIAGGPSLGRSPEDLLVRPAVFADALKFGARSA